MSISSPSPNSRAKAITAIYDIVWQASTHPNAPLSVQTVYNGSRILFKKVLLPSDSTSGATHEYNAVLKFEGGEGIYACKESLFQNFDILSLPAPSTSKLDIIPPPSLDNISLSFPPPSLGFPAPSTTNPNPVPTTTSPLCLNLTFTSSKDDDGYPFLLFHIEAPTEIRDDEGEVLKMCAMGWAKRREFDDEVPGDETCLSVGEREMLGRRREIDMDLLERDGNREGLEEGEVVE